MRPEDRLISVCLALEDALAREAWHEGDDLFAVRAEILSTLPAFAIPREIDEIDARILDRLERGQAEIRRETLALGGARRAAVAYSGASVRTSVGSV